MQWQTPADSGEAEMYSTPRWCTPTPTPYVTFNKRSTKLTWSVRWCAAQSKVPKISVRVPPALCRSSFVDLCPSLPVDLCPSSFVALRPSPYIHRPFSFVLRRSSSVLRPPSFILGPSSFVFRPSSCILRLSSFVLCPSTFVLRLWPFIFRRLPSLGFAFMCQASREATGSGGHAAVRPHLYF